DGVGRVTGVTDALSHRTTTRYLVACGPAGTGDAGCYQQTLSGDASGHQSGSLADALGRTAHEQRHSRGTAAAYGVYATTRYTYDFLGELTQILHPDGVTRTTLQYDMAGRKIAMTDPDRGAESYAYDSNGNLIQSVDARGAARTVFIGYDGLDRPLWHNTQNGAAGAYSTYSYDSTAAGSAGIGRLTGETFSAGSLARGYSFAYDARGQLSGSTLTVGSATYQVRATYDDAGDPLTQPYPDGETVTSAYSAQGWLTGVSTQQSSVTTLLGGATYSGAGGAFGSVTGAALGNGAFAYGASTDLLGR